MREPEGPAFLKPAQASPASQADSPTKAVSQPAVSLDSPTTTIAASPSATHANASHSHVQDLELLHHWTRSAALSFVGANAREQMTIVWQDAAVKQALRYPFLMHAIFSFSALHLCHRFSQDLAPSRDRWLKRSAHDYGLALTLARPELENINPHNCHAVFAFSSIVAITRMAMPTVTGDFGDGILDHMAQTFHLLRGILVVLKVAFGWVKSGPLGPAMEEIDDFDPRPIDPDIRDGLEAIELRIPREIEDREHRAAYYEAISRMRIYFAHPHAGGGADHSAAAWPVLLQAEYMDDLMARQPLALCLLAYYGIMLDEQKQHWFMQDHGKRLLVAIIQVLDDEWLPYIQVPRNRVKPEVMFSVLTFKSANSKNEAR